MQSHEVWLLSAGMGSAPLTYLGYRTLITWTSLLIFTLLFCQLWWCSQPRRWWVTVALNTGSSNSSAVPYRVCNLDLLWNVTYNVSFHFFSKNLKVFEAIHYSLHPSCSSRKLVAAASMLHRGDGVILVMCCFFFGFWHQTYLLVLWPKRSTLVSWDHKTGCIFW